MPGLPFLPNENIRPTTTQSPQTVVSQNTVRTLRLNNININIYADTSFTTEEVQFMNLLTGIAAKTDPLRGDRITISQIPIPKVTEVPVQVIQAPQEPESILASFRSYIPGFVLLFLFGGILFLSRYFSNNEDRPSQLQQRENIKHDISISDFTGSTIASTVAREQEKNDISLEIDELIKNFFNKSQEIALLFEYWLDENPDEGAYRAAEVIASVDKNLIRAVRNELQPESLDLVKEVLDSLSPMPSERKESVIRNFNMMLRTGNKTTIGSKKHSHIALFKFLDHISEAQIVELINDEGYQTGALIIDNLQDEKAARVLDRIDKIRSANIMLKMTTLSSIPYNLQSEISAKLFEKAMDLKDLEKEQRLGAENILPILDKLPLSEQQAYIDQLKATNSVVGEVVQRQFITINQLVTLTDDVIKEALQEIDTSVLLDAVYGLDQKLVDKILSVRPRREQRLIRLELDELKDKPPRDTNEAKSDIMKRIRKIVQEKKSQ